jgi:5-methylthioadenosine/S-adenosylhomocysteine deaminase
MSQPPEVTRPGGFVAKRGECVLRDGVIDNVNGHGVNIHRGTIESRSMRSARIAFLSVLLLAVTVGLVRMSRGQARTPVSLIITGGIVVTVDAANRVIPDGAIAINGGEIVAVDTAAKIAETYEAGSRIDAANQIVLPGLINTHGHAPMVLYRGLADDLALMEWLTKYIFPAEAKTVSPDFVRIGTRLAALEMIESGTTTFADMYYFESDIAEATKEAGLRAVLGQSVIKFPVADAKTPEEGLARAEAFIQQWKNDALIVPAVAPHAPYTLEPDTLKAVRALANKYDVPMLIHLAETRDEVKQIADRFHMSPTKYLESLGVWTGKSLGAHAVWVNDEDMAILGKRRVGLAHNPESNMKLASGVAPVQKWIDHGALAGLGTDGAASNNDLDMFEAMRMAAFLHKLSSNDPRAMPARLALELATRRGADALGLGAKVGSLEKGKQADVITVSVSGARQTPMFDPVSHLVYVARGDDVRNTVVAGRVLMRDRVVQTLRSIDVLRDARAMAERVRSAVK